MYPRKSGDFYFYENFYKKVFMTNCKKEERILVVDGENLLHRSYWAAYPTWKDIKNEMYVYYFLNTLLTILLLSSSLTFCTFSSFFNNLLSTS